MVWARIQAATTATAAADAGSPPPLQQPIVSTASGIWASIMKVRALRIRCNLCIALYV